MFKPSQIEIISNVVEGFWLKTREPSTAWLYQQGSKLILEVELSSVAEALKTEEIHILSRIQSVPEMRGTHLSFEVTSSGTSKTHEATLIKTWKQSDLIGLRKKARRWSWMTGRIAFKWIPLTVVGVVGSIIAFFAKLFW